MLDEVLIFRKSGIVLWRHSWVPIKGSPVNELIQQVLLEVCAHTINRLWLVQRLTVAHARTRAGARGHRQ